MKARQVLINTHQPQDRNVFVNEKINIWIIKNVQEASNHEINYNRFVDLLTYAVRQLRMIHRQTFDLMQWKQNF